MKNEYVRQASRRFPSKLVIGLRHRLTYTELIDYIVNIFQRGLSTGRAGDIPPHEIAPETEDSSIHSILLD